MEHVLIATATLCANGQVERFNRVIVPMLAKLSENSGKWEETLDTVEYALNNTVCRSTGTTPSQLLFGMDQLGKINDSLRIILESGVETERDLPALRERASVNIKKTQEENAKGYNGKRRAAENYQVGDYVMISNCDVTPGVNKKLIPKGPYVATKVLSHDRYVISDVEGNQVTRIPFEGIVGSDRMKY